MNLHPLIARFESVSGSPGNIPRLRKLVINLAIAGTLVSDKKSGPSAADILSIIRAEKTRRSKSPKNAKQPLLSPVSKEDLPLGSEDPSRFVRLEDIATIEKGLTPIQNALPGVFPLVTTAENKSLCDHFDFDGRAAIIPMVSSTGHGTATLNRLHYHDGKFALGSILCAVFPFSEDTFSARFIFEYLSAFKEELLVSRMTGTANVTLTLGRIGAVPIPILAPKVQQRIDELMTLYDQLAAAQHARENCQARLTAATHHNLNNAPDAATLRSQTQFFVAHFSSLTSRSDQIKQLRQTILNLSVLGKLTQQSSTDDSPEQLLFNIRKVREKTDKRSKNSAVDDGDPKFVQHISGNLPSSWLTCPLEDVFRFIDYRGRTPTRTSKGVRLITAKNIRMGYVANDPIEYIDERAYSNWMTRGFPKNGDLLFVTEGATMGYVGTVDLNFHFALAQRTIDLQPYLPGYSRFLFFCLMSPILQEAVLTNSTGTAVKGIKAAKLKRIRIPVPPLAEQQRIVARVDELMTLCDQLEVQFSKVQTESNRLLESVLHRALADSASVAEQSRLELRPVG